MPGRLPVLALLSGAEHDYVRMARPLLRALDATQRFSIDVVTDQSQVTLDRHAVLVAASDHPIDGNLAAGLVGFVRGGGSVILLHATLAKWSPSGGLSELAGWAPSGPGPLTELVVRRAAATPLTERLPDEWAIVDELYLSEGPPVGATVLLRASWHFSEQVVAYERKAGQGTFVYIGLGHSPETYSDAVFQRLIQRAVMRAGGHETPPPAGVGLVGYGAIARDHAAAIAATEGLKLAAVCDLSEARRAEAAQEWSVATHARSRDMLESPDVDLVVIGTPPSAHTAAVLEALDAGKHVVCEKPFALRVEEVDRMVDAAAARRLALTVYQSRRWDPDYLALRDVFRSGRIGDAFYMESFIGGYSHPCDFWHSHEPISGGTIYDWGSHYFDWILNLFPDVVDAVSAVAQKRVWHDVTNADQVRVDVTFASGAQATFLQSDIAAALKPKWYVLGTRGAVVADWQHVAVPADVPARIRVLRPAAGGTDEETLALAPRDDGGFYRNLADHLAWGEPLAVTPEEARRTVAVMETATRSIARGGHTIETQI